MPRYFTEPAGSPAWSWGGVGDSEHAPTAPERLVGARDVKRSLAIAAMLSFESGAAAAVGVAISVTTIPASAYLGVAIGAGGRQGPSARWRCLRSTSPC
jgi:hypothetical protein